LAAGDPTGWFDRLYEAGRRGEVDLPWDRGEGHPLLTQWAAERAPDGRGRRAVVVGCGLGHDAEFVATLGFDVVAFDISRAAIRTAQERRPDSPVHYVVADLFALPAEWTRAFDLVVEVYSVQALPVDVRPSIIAAITGLVADGGTLVVVDGVRDGPDPGDGPPWLVTRDELGHFATALDEVRVQRLDGRWLAEFHR
jgi:SAM-dependent methyltransferase